jgi:hypothetical protein
VPGWEVDPAGVGGVLQRAHTAAAEFEVQREAFDAVLQGVALRADSRIVTEALLGLFKAILPDVHFAVARTDAAIAAAFGATMGYKHGDEAMLANARAAMAALTDEPSR